VHPPLTCRRYQAGDHAAVADLHVLALQAAGSYADRGPWDGDLNNIERAYLESGDFVVGIVAEEIVAMGALRLAPPTSAAVAAADAIAVRGAAEGPTRLPARTCELKRMRVHPGHQRRGYGTAILTGLLRRAAQLGFERAVLDTTTRQTAAAALYRKHGFVETGTTTMFDMDCLLFARDIAPVPAAPRHGHAVPGRENVGGAP
jgi:GNAT superfamily N-acetyltransferase